ncbi:putative F-box domain, Zinc finger, SWIM-type, leucine-rich repeat domain, L [Rosa chinensis]|uniref:Putative F-box domain, Zinc finger, SWIM-type, leucine-rich repeat domain, L n=1 Tax=Rosa chinensis TaxID=74649 RepID=A0A2P6Q5A0_ROSCH|nr:F-box/LRR-repeat protein At3g48880 [Rosa chinensis]PRQ29360.1 putative F-box domain, Zinc finger, SWIM-type, leucine-rich repeat domain, L [Rosa chinensis]
MEDTAGRRKWAKLEVDCLTNVFGRLGMEPLLMNVPFVCKSWHKATQDPLCWQNLSFPEFLPLLEPKSLGPEPFYYKFVDKCQVKKNTTFSISAFVRMVVARSHGKAIEIKLPGFITEETLRYVSDACPGIRVLCMPDDIVIFKHSRLIAKLIGKWKMLEQLHLGGNLKKIVTLRAQLDKQRTNDLFAMGDYCSCETILDEIVMQIGIHCNHFVGLRIAHAYVDEVEASIIAESLPNLKYLWVEESHFEGDSLVTLVRGCKQLEVLDVTDCGELEDSDGDMKEIATLAKGYGIEFLWQGGREDADYCGLDFQNRSRKLLLTKVRVRQCPRMSTGGMAPSRLLAHRK